MIEPNMPPNSQILLSADEISVHTEDLAQIFNEKYMGCDVVFLTVMNGGMMFAADFIRFVHPDVNLRLDYIHLTRYHNDNTGSEIKWIKEPNIDLSNCHVILCDDILDEGATLASAKRYCEMQGALSVKTLVLLEKDIGRRKDYPPADYAAIQIDNHFVFGYGMDYLGKLRHLPDLYHIDSTS